MDGSTEDANNRNESHVPCNADESNKPKLNMLLLVCKKCDKEFDSSTVNCDPSQSLCSLCKVDIIHPPLRKPTAEKVGEITNDKTDRIGRCTNW